MWMFHLVNKQIQIDKNKEMLQLLSQYLRELLKITFKCIFLQCGIYVFTRKATQYHKPEWMSQKKVKNKPRSFSTPKT